MVRVLSTLAFAAALRALGVEAELEPTAVLAPRIAAGEGGDVALLTEAALAELGAHWHPGSARPLARSRVGIAVRAGAPRPEIGTEAALVRSLLAAESVVVSRAGASGQFMTGLFERLGIAAAMRSRLIVIESGYTAVPVAEGRAVLAVQQVSELLMVPGVAVVGALPVSCGGESVFGGAVFAASARGAEAAALLERIAAAHPVLRASGLAPA